MTKRIACLAVVVPLFAGCGTKSATLRTEMSPTAVPSSAGQAERSAASPLEVVLLAKSLEAIRPLSSENAHIRHKVEQNLISTCIHKRGIKYDPVPFLASDEDHSYWVAVPDERRASEQGFALSPALQAGSVISQTPADLASALDSDDPKNPGCRDAAHGSLNAKVKDNARPTFGQMVNEFQAAQIVAWDASPNVSGAMNRWSSCLGEAGLPGFKGRGLLSAKYSSTPASADAIKAAVLDARCVSTSGLFDAMVAESESVARTFVPAHDKEIRSIQKADEEELAALKAFQPTA